MTLLVIISLCIFAAYLLSICLVKGIPTSISESYYQLKRNQFIFTIFLYSICFLCVPKMLDILQNSNFQFLGFLACVSIAFVGAAPMFKGNDKMIHFIAAGVAAFCAEIVMLFLTPYWYISVGCFLASIYLIYKYKEQKIFWLEIAVFVPMYIILIIA